MSFKYLQYELSYVHYLSCTPRPPSGHSSTPVPPSGWRLPGVSGILRPDPTTIGPMEISTQSWGEVAEVAPPVSTGPRPVGPHNPTPHLIQ